MFSLPPHFLYLTYSTVVDTFKGDLIHASTGEYEWILRSGIRHRVYSCRYSSTTTNYVTVV